MQIKKSTIRQILETLRADTSEFSYYTERNGTKDYSRATKELATRIIKGPILEVEDRFIEIRKGDYCAETHDISKINELLKTEKHHGYVMFSGHSLGLTIWLDDDGYSPTEWFNVSFQDME